MMLVIEIHNFQNAYKNIYIIIYKQIYKYYSLPRCFTCKQTYGRSAETKVSENIKHKIGGKFLIFKFLNTRKLILRDSSETKQS